MKNLSLLLLLGTSIFIFSCSKESNKKADPCANGIMDGTEIGIDCGGTCKACPEPVPTKTYYLKFKADGVTKIYEAAIPGFQACGVCACCYMPPLETNMAGLTICKANDSSTDWIQPGDITGWNSKTINFLPRNVYPLASFGYTDAGVDYSTDNAASQTGSSVSITKVESDGTYGTAQSYKVTGTFKCTVAKSGGSNIAVTEGAFVVKYTQDY